jgi:hypothetical protein
MQFHHILLYFVEMSSVFTEKVNIFDMDKSGVYWYIIAKGDDIHESAQAL